MNDSYVVEDSLRKCFGSQGSDRPHSEPLNAPFTSFFVGSSDLQLPTISLDFDLLLYYLVSWSCLLSVFVHGLVVDVTI